MTTHSHRPHPGRRASGCCSCNGRRALLEWLRLTRARNSSRIACTPACEMLDGVASWVVHGIATAFFMSLELCSCIYLGTEDGPEDHSLLPLIRDRGRLEQDATAEDEKDVEVELSPPASVDVERGYW
ncbi:uncharacterized protein J3R85_011290 [Psidium guajava]|nr:uncharacterized protein J3R85_011290 [Psidium guajava]